jgi:hypothetical protein
MVNNRIFAFFPIKIAYLWVSPIPEMKNDFFNYNNVLEVDWLIILVVFILIQLTQGINHYFELVLKAKFL